MAESALDRKLGRFTYEQISYALLLGVALFLRLYVLHQKPMHHDESIHAFFSWKITDAGVGDYKYDPVYHGPVLYFATALMLFLFGDSDFTVRLSAVAFGMGVLLFAWPLRRYLGRWGALSFLVLATFSPAFLYFTRFLRHDIFLALCNLATIYFLFRYGETRRPRHLYLAATAFGFAFTTKEDMYLLTPLFLLSFAAMLIWEVMGAPDRAAAARRAWSETRSFFAGIWVPLLTSAIIFAVIWLTLYTSFFTHKEKWNAVSSAIAYWWGQHTIKRIGGPWWYYLPQLTLYDPLIFFPIFFVVFGPLRDKPRWSFGKYLLYLTVAAFAGFLVCLFKAPGRAPLVLLGTIALLVGALATRWVPDRFTRFSILWALGSLAIYAWAQEKVPWLLVPILTPLLLVAGRWFGDLIETGALRRPTTVLTIAPIAALTLWTMVAVNYLYDAPHPEEPKEARHAEMLVYVQSTYDVIKVMHQIDDVAKALGTGTKTRLAVSGNATWPFSWYLRHYPVNWGADLRTIDTPVVIVDRENKALEKPLAEAYTQEYFEIRGWWEPDWNQLDAPKLMRWLFTRMAWNGNGSSDAQMYVHKNLVSGMSFPSIAVNPPPAARSYPKSPEPLQPLAVWGALGSAPGQFSEPRGLALASSGDLYVVDSKNDRIEKLSSADGHVLTTWGKQGDGSGEFKDPCGIAVGPDGSVYVADTWNHRIQKFDPNGTFLKEWHEQDPGFWGPRGIAVAPSGTVFVTDTGNKRVLAYTGDGKRTAVWGKEGTKQGEFIEPVGIAVDSKGRVVVADTGNRRLQFFDEQGKFLEEWQVYGWEEFYTEPYIAVSGDQIYVTDSYNQRFARYSGNHETTGVWGKTGNGPGDFNRPIGIAVAPDGTTVYISDTLNNRIQKFAVPPPRSS